MFHQMANSAKKVNVDNVVIIIQSSIHGLYMADNNVIFLLFENCQNYFGSTKTKGNVKD